MPKWNDEMLQHLSQEQAETVAGTLSALFQSHPEIEIACKEDARPNVAERTFTIQYSVCLWYDNMLVAVFNHPGDLDRFITVARLMSQEQAIKTYHGECSQCERETLVSTASGLCEGCVLAAQLDN